MFERFTDRARRVLVLAQEEARLLNHNFIGTEHILLGMIHEGEGVAARALESLGISLEAVRDKVTEIIGQAGSPATGSPPFTPRAKQALELSLREALKLGHNYIGTEHLLLGLLREGEGVAAEVLTAMGADLARVRTQVIDLLAGRPVPDLRAGVAPDAVEPAEVRVPAAALLGQEDAAKLLLPDALELDAMSERTEIHGVVYDTCTYSPRLPAEIALTVAGAIVTREAFDAYTSDSLPDAEPVEGLGDAATFSADRGSLRVLTGETLLLVRVRRHPSPKEVAVAAARRALDNLSLH